MLVAPLALVSIALAAPLVAASPAVSVEDRSILDTIVAGATGTLKCPTGYTYGSVTDKRTIPASLKTISPIIDSFFDAEWEGFTIASTTGKDNLPGATRSFSFGGAVDLTEKLISNVNLSPLYFDRLWKGVGGKTAGTLPVDAVAFNAKLASWTEHLTILPACGGKASQFTWTASYCSTNDPVAESLFTQAHTGPYAGLETKFGTYSTCSAI